MKRNLFFLLFIVSLSAKGQTNVYHPFPDSDAEWCCWKAYFGACTLGPNDYYYSKYQLNGKTIINGITYSILNHYEVDYLGSLNCPTVDTIRDATTYYIHQDSALKTIWIYDTIT